MMQKTRSIEDVDVEIAITENVLTVFLDKHEGLLKERASLVRKIQQENQ